MPLQVSLRIARNAAGIAALLCLTVGCGSGSAAVTPPASNVPPPVIVAPVPETIQGVATPSSVSVVTATNAN
jgi:hypothetical protein